MEFEITPLRTDSMSQNRTFTNLSSNIKTFLPTTFIHASVLEIPEARSAANCWLPKHGGDCRLSCLTIRELEARLDLQNVYKEESQYVKLYGQQNEVTSAKTKGKNPLESPITDDTLFDPRDCPCGWKSSLP